MRISVTGMMVRVKTDLPKPALAEEKFGTYTVTYEMVPAQRPPSIWGFQTLAGIEIGGY